MPSGVLHVMTKRYCIWLSACCHARATARLVMALVGCNTTSELLVMTKFFLVIARQQCLNIFLYECVDMSRCASRRFRIAAVLFNDIMWEICENEYV